VDYRKYIASSAWRHGAARRAAVEAAGNLCGLCPAEGSPEAPLEAHHRTYTNLGCERVDDLTMLCRDCHRGVTSMLRARRYAARPAATADFVPTVATPKPLFDSSAMGEPS
jgi:hypothetical protein